MFRQFDFKVYLDLCPRPVQTDLEKMLVRSKSNHQLQRYEIWRDIERYIKTYYK